MAPGLRQQTKDDRFGAYMRRRSNAAPRFAIRKIERARSVLRTSIELSPQAQTNRLPPRRPPRCTMSKCRFDVNQQKFRHRRNAWLSWLSGDARPRILRTQYIDCVDVSRARTRAVASRTAYTQLTRTRLRMSGWRGELVRRNRTRDQCVAEPLMVSCPAGIREARR
jgi:hypothetical protein